MMAPIRCACIFACLALVGVCLASETSQEFGVINSCNRKLKNIDSIAKFKEFMSLYKLFTSNNDMPRRGFLSNSEQRLRKCFNLHDALMELERIVDSRRDGVCSMRYINELIDFKVKHILKLDDEHESNARKDLDKIDSKSSYIAFFFTVYAYQVAYHCKSQLPAKLQAAQREQDCSRILDEMMPEGLNGDSNNIEEQDDEIKVAAALLRESKVENFVPIMHFKHLHLPVAHIDVIVPNAAVSRIDALKSQCRKVEPYYTASLSPIGALAQFGYEVDSKLVDDQSGYQESESRIKCWLGAAQLCQGLLRTHMKVSEQLDVDPNSDSKLITVELEGSPSELPKKTDQINPTISGDVGFEEVSSVAVTLAKKRFTLKSKMKWRVSNSIKKFIERRIDIKGTQEEALRGLVESVKSMDNNIDKKVSFGGNAIYTKAFDPSSVITDKADGIIRTASPVFNKEVGFFMSCVVGVVMTAVFIYLSVYMSASVVKHSHFTADGKSKGDWKKLRDEKMTKVKENLTGGKRNKFGMHVYKPQ